MGAYRSASSCSGLLAHAAGAEANAASATTTASSCRARAERNVSRGSLRLAAPPTAAQDRTLRGSGRSAHSPSDLPPKESGARNSSSLARRLHDLEAEAGHDASALKVKTARRPSPGTPHQRKPLPANAAHAPGRVSTRSAISTGSPAASG
jgi:hypothetical protein